MSAALLVLNIGSSTIKFALYPADGDGVIARGRIENVGHEPALVMNEGGDALDGAAPPQDKPQIRDLTIWLLETLSARFADREISGIGHRVVHGGPDFAAPVRVTPDILDSLDRLTPLAPQHQPHNLAGIHAAEALWAGIPQVACFDTAFHHARPRLSKLFALPRALSEEGILRYGFHGLSYAHIARLLPGTFDAQTAAGKVIVAHLGSGVSLCGMEAGTSVSTTMGFTALDGVMMGTRCGQIDPGVLIHLMRDKGLDADALEKLLGKQSGLLGVSGISNDMRKLAASDAPEAEEAIALFAASILHHIGALAADLGGLDGLVFTAGIGEHDAALRLRVMHGLAWLGLIPDEAANEAHGPIISRPESRISAAVIPTDEEAEIRDSLRALL
ncbi:MAG: acetate kinase AckA [Saliniramus fredricksonii]|uniref:Acetate kinase n=1 Tax=Saliniramus fredricksonii TaxID=1653334 RepID=A0A0P8BPN7_9HYPH|nr:acetate/propionate family kinase [Saliniramus fredricksonii]KPQ11556.1 MAG: acetate kinase AckA [Saliniramus fredricksonii]SCC82463.1 acetate kinase [Saliniramus fredricksonii]